MTNGTRVKILGGLSEFIGQTGTVSYSEKDGSIKMYRVHLDTPVDVPGVGTVTSDLWAASLLKRIK